MTTPPATTDRMLYCGPTQCDELGGDEVMAGMNEPHAVRCCTDNANLNWPYACKSIVGVFGQSNVPSCYSSKTFNEAVEICSLYDGGRLCTSDEMKDKCTSGVSSNSFLLVPI